MHWPSEFRCDFVDDDLDIMDIWKLLTDLMGYSESNCFDEPDGQIHDISAYLIDDLIIDCLMQVISHGCAIYIRFHAHIHEIVAPPDLLVGIISVVGKKGHAFEFDFSHFKLETSSEKLAVRS
jgi:hypothetical protein